ncbi:hypothetical protein [Modestobacter sp. NPDC049651]|uniref:hypothetical protein n=1 Tax=unclassified Modestobacter TaxID=2643866 RepID=UPI0033D30C36
MELDEVADELYAVPPEEFVPARTAARDRARAEGDKELAAQVAALPKPSTAAWVCNLLVRRQHDEIAQLVGLGELLRQAQANLSGDQLKELGRQRSQVVAALTRQARSLAHQEGHDVSTSIAEQVEGTLRAAVADPDAGAALLAGRLTGALSYTGLGPVDLSGAVAPSAPARPAPPPQRAGRAAGEAQAVRRAEDEERRRREEAERRRRELAQARQDAEEAARVAAETREAAEDAERRLAEVTDRRDQLRARVDELEQELRRTERQATTAAGEVTDAEKRRDAASRRAGTAAAIAERAHAHADRLAAAAGDG